MSRTPGPWVVDGQQVVTLAACHPNRTYGYGCGNDFVCDLNDGEYHQYRNDKEQAANARLIAAAPDLLEALKGLVEAADQDWPHAPKCDPAESPCCCEVIEIGRATQKARAAIAKAEGEE